QHGEELAAQQRLAGADLAGDLDEALAVGHRHDQRVEGLLRGAAGEEIARVGSDAEGRLAQAEMAQVVHRRLSMRRRVSVTSCSQSRSESTMVGLSRMTSSFLLTDLSVLRRRLPSPESDTPGMPPRVSRMSMLIRPPIATMLPSTTRTTVSVSLTVLLASGRRISAIALPRLTMRVLSVTSLTAGWMCRMMLLASSICGVTSSTMPEKNGCTVTEGDCTVEVPVVVAVVVTLVTKNSSVPTLSTALLLLMVAMRGLESTCTLPCVSRKVSSAAKFLACSARPKTDPAAPLVPVAAAARPAGSTVNPGATIGTPDGVRVVPPVTCPTAATVLPLRKACQLMPA